MEDAWRWSVPCIIADSVDTVIKRLETPPIETPPLTAASTEPPSEEVESEQQKQEAAENDTIQPKDGDFIVPDILVGEGKDINLLEEYKVESSKLHATNEQFREIGLWWEKAHDEGWTEEQILEDYPKLAKRIGLTPKQISGYKKFYLQKKKEEQEELNKVRKTSLKARGNPGSELRASEINKRLKNPAYKDRKHKDHPRIMAELNNLYAGRLP